MRTQICRGRSGLVKRVKKYEKLITKTPAAGSLNNDIFQYRSSVPAAGVFVMDFSYFHPALPVQIAGGDFGLIDVVFTDLAVAQTNHAVRHVFDRIIVCYHNDGVAVLLIDVLDQLQNFF